MAEEDISTIGELGRLIRTLQQDVRDIPKSFLALQVWEVEKRAMEESRRNLGREIGELRSANERVKAEKKADHDAFELELRRQEADYLTRISTLKAKLDERNEAARKERARNWFAIGLAALGVIFTAIGGVLVANINTALGLLSGGG